MILKDDFPQLRTPLTLNVLILDPCWKHAPALFSEHGIGVLAAEREASADRIDFVIVRSSSTLDAARLASLQRRGLQVVLRAGSGLDNIDTAYCVQHGIGVVNFPGRNADSVAEVTLSYMLSGMHRLYPANAEMRGGVFAKEKYQGRNLASATVAFVGYGATARATAGLLRSIGVRDLLACQRSPIASDPHSVRFVDLATCFQADVVSINVPLNDQTRMMIGEEQLASARPGLFLINIARRDVVDHAALLRQLEAGRVSGYACDVLDPLRDAALIARGDVFATPHLGAQSEDCQRIIAHAILDFMRSFVPKPTEQAIPQ
jgi:D-3-phosphoglycerate dehydrogenase